MNEFLVSLISGGCAGTATDLAFFPIDTLKTRLQAKGGFFHNGGWKGVYRGLGSAVIASAPSASLFFVTYDRSKKYFKAELMPLLKNENLTLNASHMTAASLGEIAACLVRVPAEVIKQRAQTSKFSSSLESLKFILKNENGEGVIRGLYRGWTSTIVREIPFTTIQYPLYEYMKLRWASHQGVEKVSPLQGAVCGSIAGGFAAAVTTPLDVLKTRIMLSSRQISIGQVASQLYKEEGFAAFWSGVGPRTMWISAGGAIFLGMYETVNSLLRAEEDTKLE